MKDFSTHGFKIGFHADHQSFQWKMQTENIYMYYLSYKCNILSKQFG